ncbi:MAG: hypothetical protein KC996_07255 [Phycisphaerales bacterium]|nr:hypothetical protein [Phycisphaerales bacterium]
MSDRRPHPACPHCFYSFAGHQPDGQGRATCPECGAYTAPIDAANSGVLDRSTERQRLKDLLLALLGVVIFLALGGAALLLSEYLL